MTRIGVLADFIKPGRVGGAEFMAYALIRGLSDMPSVELTVFYDAEHPLGEAVPGVSYEPLSTRWGKRFGAETLSWRRYRKLDALLCPNYFTPPLTRPRTVTAILDAQFRHFPENFTFAKRLWLRTAHRLSMIQADAVVAISEHVRRELLEIYGYRYSTKLHAIHIPVDWGRLAARHEATIAEFGDRRFLLAVSAAYPHKNLDTLVRAFALLAQKRPELQLVIAGQLPGRLIGVRQALGLEPLIEGLGLSDRVHLLGHVTDAQLGELYRLCSVFVFPSLFEGFGLPPVEALGMGKPVVTTRATSLPEVTRGLATYCDHPRDPQALASAIGGALDHPEAHAISVEDVAQIRAWYSLDRIAREYYRLLVPDLPAQTSPAGAPQHRSGV